MAPTRSSASATASSPPASLPLSLTRPRRSGPKRTKPAAGEEPEHCPACAEGVQRVKQRREVWVSCHQCEAWYHWTCVAPAKTDSPDLIDKWYCSSCITASESTPTPLSTTFKPPPRKSARASSKIDYANLDAHLPADVERWLKVLATKETVSGAFKTMKVEEITDEWIWSEESFLEPFLIEQPEGLGMTMPPSDMGIQEIAKVVGPKTPIEVIDVASQSSLSHWTLQQWADYYTDPNRDKVRNVISLEVSESPLSPQVVAPEIVRKLDWVDNIWPQAMKRPGEYPRVQKYCLMSVARCWTDWHVDFAGSSVFYHILRGEKVFYFIRPTPANLAAYERWSGSAERQETTWLGDDVDCVYKVELTAGNTMIIPTGWPHAVYTPCDTLVFGGNFLHSLNIPTQLRVYAIELATKVPRKFRFPHFVKLLWFVANHYSYRLASILPFSTASAADAPPPPPTSLPLDMNLRVLEGLKELSTFLLEQSTRMPKDAPVSAERRRIARENVPWEMVKDPAGLARRLRVLVMQARGEKPDEACFAPAVKVEDVGPSPVGTPNGGKRKAESPTQEGQTIRFKNWDGARSNGHPSSQSALATSQHNTRSHPPAPSSINPEGHVLSRVSTPLSTTDRRELRSDPSRPNLGASSADVRTSETTTTVVRRVEEEGGAVVLETRSVITQVERVRWPGPAELGAPSTKIRLVMPSSKGSAGSPAPQQQQDYKAPTFDQHAPPRPLQFAPFQQPYAAYPPPHHGYGNGYSNGYPPPPPHANGYAYPPSQPGYHHPYPAPPPSASQPQPNGASNGRSSSAGAYAYPPQPPQGYTPYAYPPPPNGHYPPAPRQQQAAPAGSPPIRPATAPVPMPYANGHPYPLHPPTLPNGQA